jgi:hypothetical protein
MRRWRQRVRLEDGLKLDLNRLVRLGVVRPGQSLRGGIAWSYKYTNEPVASGMLATESHGDWGSLRLELGSLDQRIELVSVPRHFGGAQWYFLCPFTRRRVSVLWKPPGANRFGSRQTWGRQVAYGSQFEPWNDRALKRAREIRYRLGGENFVALDGLQPPRPKGMHWRTYEAQLERAEAYEMKCELYLAGLIARLNGRGI